MDRPDTPQAVGGEQSRRRRYSILLVCECVLLAVLYTVPFLLEKTAKKHMMFYRYLIVKQHWWANDMFYCRLVLTVLAVALTVYIIWNIRKKRQSGLLQFRMVSIVCLAASAIVMNIEPSLSLMHFLLLIASWAAVLLSLLITITLRMKGRK